MIGFAAAIMNKQEGRGGSRQRSGTNTSGMFPGGGIEDAEDNLVDHAAEEDSSDQQTTDRSCAGKKLNFQGCMESLNCRKRRGLRPPKPTGIQRLTMKARKKLKESDPGRIVDKVDTVSKFMFPMMYCTFNFFYWAAFLYWIPDEIKQIRIVREYLEKSERA